MWMSFQWLSCLIFQSNKGASHCSRLLAADWLTHNKHHPTVIVHWNAKKVSVPLRFPGGQVGSAPCNPRASIIRGHQFNDFFVAGRASGCVCWGEKSENRSFSPKTCPSEGEQTWATIMGLLASSLSLSAQWKIIQITLIVLRTSATFRVSYRPWALPASRRLYFSLSLSLSLSRCLPFRQIMFRFLGVARWQGERASPHQIVPRPDGSGQQYIGK